MSADFGLLTKKYLENVGVTSLGCIDHQAVSVFLNAPLVDEILRLVDLRGSSTIIFNETCHIL